MDPTQTPDEAIPDKCKCGRYVAHPYPTCEQCRIQAREDARTVARMWVGAHISIAECWARLKDARALIEKDGL